MGEPKFEALPHDASNEGLHHRLQGVEQSQVRLQASIDDLPDAIRDKITGSFVLKEDCKHRQLGVGILPDPNAGKWMTDPKILVPAIIGLGLLIRVVLMGVSGLLSPTTPQILAPFAGVASSSTVVSVGRP